MAHHDDELDDSAAPLVEHLAELRTRLIRSLLVFIVGFVICFIFGQPLLKFLLAPIENAMHALGNPNPVMQYTAPQEYFFTLMRIAMVAGLGLSFPAIAFQLWRFVAPGLYKNEQQAFLPFLIASPVLFLLGAAMAHYMVTPLAMKFFLGFADASSLISAVLPDGVPSGVEVAQDASEVEEEGISIVFNGKVNETLDISLKLILAFGLCFQLPVLLTLMGKAGLVSADGLKTVRKYAVVGILTLAAIITPPDVISQVILFTVVYGLYEISIFLVARFEAERETFDDEEEDVDVDDL